jgi:outer membrane protein assembly factor BamB
MPSRRRVLAALGAGLAGCTGRRDPAPTPDTPLAPPLSYEPQTPSSPTPRSSPLPVDRSFTWPAPFFDGAHSHHPPTTGPTESPTVQWELWLPQIDRARAALIEGPWLYVLGDRRLTTVDRRSGRRDASVRLPVNPLTAPTLTEEGLVVPVEGEETPRISLVGTNGDVRWVHESGPVILPPAVDERRLYVPAGDALVARNLADGTEIWRHKAADGDRISTYPAVSDGFVYALASPGTCYAVDADSGKRLWRDASGPDRAPAVGPSVGGDRVFGGFGDGAGTIAYEREKGERAWIKSGTRPRGTQATTDDRVVTAAQQGQLAAFERARGTSEWREPAGAGPPIVAGETVYVRGPRGDGTERIVARSLADGRLRWERPVTGGGWLRVADGYCYLNYGSGVIQCLG